MPELPPDHNTDPVDQIIARLYRSVLSVPTDQFRTWALDSLNAVIPHDGALWGSGIWEERRFHTVTVTGLPADFPLALQRTADQNPLIRKLIVSPPDTPTTMESVFPDARFFRSDLYRDAFKPAGVERILSMIHLDARSGLYSLLSLYRRDRSARFTVAEKAHQRRLTYHLFNAASHSFFIHLARTHRDRPAQAAAAVVDQRGLFHEAQPRFLDALDQHFAGHRGNQLPFPLPEPGETRTLGTVSVRAEPLGDMFVLHLWPSVPLDRLTSREREIVLAVAHGLSFKQAARQIGVAPSTVANHLYRIYRKLGVASRTDLAKLVHVDNP